MLLKRTNRVLAHMLSALTHRAPMRSLHVTRCGSSSRENLLSSLFFNGLAITSHNAFDQLLPSPDGTAACIFLRTSIIGIPS